MFSSSKHQIIEFLLASTAMLVIFFTVLSIQNGMFISNDGYQYLSIASNFMNGDFAQTSIVHFDPERSHAIMPAPVTTFPVGYSFVLSLIASTGISLLWAAAIVSIAVLVCTVLYIQYFSRLFSLSSSSRYFLYVWIAANSTTYIYSTGVLSEILFTLLTTLAVLFFISAIKLHEDNRAYVKALIVGGVLIGLTYWMRYAGLFLFVSASVYFFVQWIVQRNKFHFIGLVGLTLSAVIISAGLIRNIILVDTWKGGNTLANGDPLSEVVYDFVLAIYHLLLGSSAAANLGIFEILFIISVFIIAFLVLRYVATDLKNIPFKEPLYFIALFVVVYSAAMIYAATVSPISFGSRMFVPILPSIGLLIAFLISYLDTKLSSTALKRALLPLLILFFISYAGINSRLFLADPSTMCHTKLAEALSADNDIYAWVQGNIGDDEIIASNNGHGSQYLLKKNTISLVSQRYTTIKWDALNLEKVLSDFNASYLLVYNEDYCASKNSVAKVLLEAVNNENEFPKWLTPVIENQNARLYKLQF